MNGRIRRGVRAALGMIGMPERLAEKHRQANKKPGQYTFWAALAAEQPPGKSQASSVEQASNTAAEELAEIVSAALRAEGHNGDKSCVKQFQEAYADEIKAIMSETDPVVRNALLKASAERFALGLRPAAGNSYKRKGLFG